MPKDTASETRPRLKAELYRQARLWHGWLSAAAFLALIFFAGTGLLLNNPDWFERKPVAVQRTVVLTPAELAAARTATDPDRAVAETVARKLALRGVYQPPRPQEGGPKPGKREKAGKTLRLRGVTGGSEIVLDSATGVAQVKTEPANLAAVLTNLHKGKNAGPAWHVLIDAVAIAVLSLSLLGYVLFFALRFRLRTGLILTGLTLAAAVGLFVATVP
jgi:hypothetical protein